MSETSPKYFFKEQVTKGTTTRVDLSELSIKASSIAFEPRKPKI